ncbi:EAL domain-containing protein [Aquabacter sp. CN5-332]|uniref:bifunctional diguanylate cyclase/phosphodiesterase n=1 Tax=Aquabacter sp. CN5-332 TaxID=3156608 RepID=UPI0032B418C6
MKFSQAKLIVGASVSLALLLMASAILYVSYDKQFALEYNRTRIENASAVLMEFVGKTILGIDRVLTESSREVISVGDGPARSPLERKFADYALGINGLSALFALDPDGAVVAGSRMQPLPNARFSDRSYFINAMNSQESRLVISETMMSRVMNKWQFFASRPVIDGNGNRLGVITASIDTDLFQEVLGSYRPDPDIVIGLFTTDFKLIARAPSEASQFGISFALSKIFQQLQASGGDEVSMIAPGYISGIERFSVVKKVPELPLILTVSVPTERLYAQWSAHSRLLLSLAGGMSAFIVFAGVAGARSIRRQEETSSLLDTMFTQTPACIALAGSGGTLIKCNDNWTALNDLFDVPADIRGDVFQTLRHAVRQSGDSGLTKGRKKALHDINAVTAGAKDNGVLELRCVHEDADRYFTVNISRFALVAGREARGFAVLVVDISKQRALELRLRSQLVMDSQTGLANREGFLAALAALIPNAVGEDCLFVFDIVGLAELKEIRGFDVSDEAFSAVGAKVGALADLGCIAGRIDSEKFCVFMPGAANGATPAERLQNLVRHVAHEYRLSGHTFNVRMTVGGARVADVGQDAEKLVQAAEIAHGLARRRGPASSAFFNAKIEADAHERVRLYESLQKGIADQEFELEFQPKVDLATGAVVGAEALVRWRHPIFGLQPPSSFIPMAEESGLIVPIGDWVMRDVMRMLASWPQTGEGPVPISINVSPAQFDRENVDIALADHLRRYGIKPDLVVIELTESVFSLHLEETVAKINRIRETGVRVSLDDFGTGYSSLSYLNLMNFDELKVDGSFVRKITSDIVSRSIVEMTLGLARTLNVSVTAEGIETEEQRQALMSMGCRSGQGFLFSTSLPAAELQAVVQEQRRLLPHLPL